MTNCLTINGTEQLPALLWMCINGDAHLLPTGASIDKTTLENRIEMSSLTKSNIVWDKVNKAFQKSIDGDADKNTGMLRQVHN